MPTTLGFRASLDGNELVTCNHSVVIAADKNLMTSSTVHTLSASHWGGGVVRDEVEGVGRHR